MKKTIAILIAILMLMTCIPFAVEAEGEEVEPTEWIEIYTFEDLDNVRYDLTANYKLMNDIDMTEWVKPGGDYDYFGNGWNPIGSADTYASDAFSGIFDGNGHTISGLRMNVTQFPAGTGSTVYFALFAAVSGTVRNLTVAGSITVSDSKNNYAGGITAFLNEAGLIENCTNEIKLKVQGENNQSVGGIVGRAYGIVKNCRNVASVNVSTTYNSSAYCYAAGIVGIGSSSSPHPSNSLSTSDLKVQVFSCLNSGTVFAYSYCSGYSASSGIVNYAKVVQNCFNVGEIEDAIGEGGLYVDYFHYLNGIAHLSTVSNCYNIGKVYSYTHTTSSSYKTYNNNYAISGRASTNCFYLKGSGITSTGAVEKTAAQLKRQIQFTGWDFDNVWTMEGRDDYFYPELRDVPLLLPDDFKTPISGTVKIDGAQEAGSVLTASIDNLTPEDATFSYSWKLDDAEVSTTESYQVQAEDIGKTLTLTVSGTGDFKGTLTASCVLGAPHEHTEEVIPAVPATCTEAGLTEGMKCSACGEILVAQEEIPANGHTPVTAGALKATCGKAGFSGVTYCSVCNRVLDRGETIPATGAHTPGTAIETILTQVTCTEAGEKKITVKCTVCGETISETTQETPALGHADADENGNCTRCGTLIKDVTNPGSNGSSQQSGGKTRTGFFGWLSNLFSRIFSIFKR